MELIKLTILLLATLLTIGSVEALNAEVDEYLNGYYFKNILFILNVFKTYTKCYYYNSYVHQTYIHNIYVHHKLVILYINTR